MYQLRTLKVYYRLSEPEGNSLHTCLQAGQFQGYLADLRPLFFLNFYLLTQSALSSELAVKPGFLSHQDLFLCLSNSNKTFRA